MRRVSAIALLLLAGCASGPHEWEKPWLREPVPYAPKGEPAVEGPQTIDLPAVLRLAGANSLDVAWVRERVHEAYARQELAEERFLPTIGPSFYYKRHEGLTQATDGSFPDVDKQAAFAGGDGTLSWQLGEAVFATLAASRRLEGSRATLEASERSAVLDAAIAYYDLVRETLKARVAGDSVKAAEQMAGEFDAAVKAGRGFRGDVLRARVRAADSRLAEARARDAAKQASVRLVSLLRLAPGIELVPVEEVPAKLSLVPEAFTEKDWIDRALSTRPEVRAAESEVAASRHDRNGVVYGPLVPEVQGSVSGGQLGPEFDKPGDTADYQAAVSWKIGPGGILDFGRQDLAAASLSGAEVSLARVRQRVVDEVRSAVVQLRGTSEQTALAEQEVKDAEESLRLNRERQQAGMGLPLEYLEAEISQARAHQDFDVALIEYNQAQVRLLIASGGPLPR